MANESSSIAGHHAEVSDQLGSGSTTAVKAQFQFDKDKLRELNLGLATVKATTKELADELERAAKASAQIQGQQGGGPSNYMPGGGQGTNTSVEMVPGDGGGQAPGDPPGGPPGGRSGRFGRFGGAGGGGFIRNIPAQLGAAFGGSALLGLGLLGAGGLGAVGRQGFGAIDQRVDRNRAYALPASQAGVQYRLLTGASEQSYESYRRMIVGQPGSTMVDPNAIIGFESQTGFGAAQTREAYAAGRVLGGYAPGSGQRVLDIIGQNLDPAVANRQFMMMGGGSMLGPGGQPRDAMSTFRQRMKMFQLDDPYINRDGSARLPGSISRQRMTEAGVPLDEQDLLIQMGMAQQTFRAKGGTGAFDPTNPKHLEVAGVEDTFAVQFDETERRRQEREENMFSEQNDNYAQLEKNTQTMIGHLENIERFLGDAIGARTSTRQFMSIGGRVLQLAGAGLMLSGVGVGAGAAALAAGTAIEGSGGGGGGLFGGDPTESGGGSSAAPAGVTNNSSSANDANIQIPVGYGGAKKSLTEVKQRSDFQKMHPKMQQRMLAMFRENPGLGIGGGWRDSKAQEQMFLSRYEQTSADTGVRWNGKNWKRVRGAPAAPPGRSMHEIGLAADLIGDLDWLQRNASRFGLKTFADVNNEPWHIQPVELPNSRRKYEDSGAAWGTDGDFEEDAVFTEQPGTSGTDEEEYDSHGAMGSPGDFTGASIQEILDEYLARGPMGLATGGRRPSSKSNNSSQDPSSSASTVIGSGATISGEGQLTGQQVAQAAYNAGFRGDDLVKLVAIAKRESSWNSRAYNGNRGTGDQSYGLMQINMIDSIGPARREAFGISSNEELYNPNVNMRATMQMFQGRDSSFYDWGPYKGKPATYNTNVGEAAQIVADSGLSGDPVEAAPMVRPRAPRVTPATGGGGVTSSVTHQYQIDFRPEFKFEGVPETPELRRIVQETASYLKEQTDIALKRSE